MAVSDGAESEPSSSVLDLDERYRPLALVRRWVGDVLSGLTEDDLDDCVLVVNELVSNAFDHGSGPRRVRLRRFPERCVVRVEVDDASPDQLVVGRSRVADERGRGLVIVDRLSKAWAVDLRVDGKTVWAEMACSPPAPADDGR